MTLTQKLTVGRVWRVMIMAAFAMAVAAACSGSPGTARTSSRAAGYGAPVAASSASSGAATVMTRTGAAGTYLADGTGRTLYLFEADKPGVSNCVGTCLQFWPPFVTKADPTAGPGVQAGMLSTLKRSDGSLQVQYNGHPLYYFSEDTKPGDTLGQGVNGSGALWWIVGPNGNAITTSGSGGTNAPSPGTAPATPATPATPTAPAAPGGYVPHGK